MLLKPFRIINGGPLAARTRRLQHEPVADSQSSFGQAGLAAQRIRRFAAMCCFIGVVSVHDAYLLLHNRQNILDHERNPVGRWLIELGGGDVFLFVVVKLTTTAAVCSFLIWMYQRSPRQTQSIAAGVAAFQLGLLLYLMGA